jgi:UDP-N-acetylglucosamine--N-acetylmuramyl-(pentapeptide) pyrophosphoryl-undecaprenol N-acetylglucosamine transferase
MPDSRFLFIGVNGKMEMELVPRAGYEIRGLDMTYLVRGHDLHAIAKNLETVRNVARSTREARKIIRDFQPDAVIGTGGYICYPVLAAAHEEHVPTLIHESNAVPGLTTKMLAGTVDRIMVGFEESRAQYHDPERVVVTGTPVRGEFDRYTREAARAQLGIPEGKPLVVSVWGSLGSGHMNGKLLELLPLLRGQKDFHLIHAVGSRDYAEFREKLAALALDPADCGVEIREYIYDMPRVMAAADLILCRAGASTLSELSYMGKPAILVPSPNVTNHHQERNARVLERAGGAKVLLEGEFDAESLLELIRALLDDPAQLREMSAAMRSLAVPGATDRICSEILSLLQA